MALKNIFKLFAGLLFAICRLSPAACCLSRAFRSD